MNKQINFNYSIVIFEDGYYDEITQRKYSYYVYCTLHMRLMLKIFLLKINKIIIPVSYK